MYTELSYDVDGHVGVITLRRPEARNALTYTTYRELEDAVRNASVRCLVITGADPAFCSGDDVKQIMAGGEGARPAVTNLAPRLTPAHLARIELALIEGDNAETLQEFPELNARLERDEIVFLDRYDLGVAVQTDEGLVVPVVRDCSTRSVEELGADVARLAEAARACPRSARPPCGRPPR